jgi:hypothetical protein
MHVNSWANITDFPVMVVRYEDMLNDSLNCFSSIAAFVGINTDSSKIKACIEQTSFKKLQEKERSSGFKEKLPKTKQFFRSGKAGNWKTELTREQALSIVTNHKDVMMRYGYDTDIDKYYT